MACQIANADFALIFIAGGCLGIAIGYMFRFFDEDRKNP